MSSAPVLEARGLVKKYGHVTAINGADFELREGEVLAVIGDNGAGKTSLIKALAGAVIPDAGEILMNGTSMSFKNTRDARAAGIETVYQDLAVVQALDIASHRVDAWATALASSRRATLAPPNPTGMTLGAFGYVEDVRLSRLRREPDGWIHAPSTAHAVTAGVLASAHV